MLFLFILFNLIVCLSLLACFSEYNIYSVLSLLFFFTLISILLFYFNLEFLGLMILIIYAGAIAVFFVFFMFLTGLSSRIRVDLTFIQSICLAFLILSTNLSLFKGWTDAQPQVCYWMPGSGAGYLWENEIHLLGCLLFGEYSYLIVILAVTLLMVLVGVVAILSLILRLEKFR